MGIGVPPDEFGRRAERESDDVVKHQNLRVAVGPGSDADGRNAKPPRDDAGKLARNSFQDQREGASIFDRLRVGKYLPGRLERPPLNAMASEGMNGLRRQPDMAHDGDLFPHQTPDKRAALAAPFKLHCFRPAFLEVLDGDAKGFLAPDVVAAIGEIGNQQSAPHATPTAPLSAIFAITT